MKYSEITCCEDCPLHDNDCSGGYISGGNGEPIEPPCCSWDDDTEVYEYMYSSKERKESTREVEWARKRQEKKEQEERNRKEKLFAEEIKVRINKISKYGNAKIENGGELCYRWFCPRCNNWFHPFYESSSGGVTETHCTICGENLAHSRMD